MSSVESIASRESLELNSLLRLVVDNTHIPGVSVSVLYNGHLISAAAGVRSMTTMSSMSNRARFDIGCITETLVSLIALELVSRGDLDLMAPIGTYLPDLGDTYKASQVLVWHLLSHSSGYQGPSREMEIECAQSAQAWPQFAEYLHQLPQIFSPGTIFNYHVADYVILEEILRRIKGMDALQIVRATILDPLRISSRPTEPVAVAENSDDSEVDDHRWNRIAHCFEPIERVDSGPAQRSSLSNIRLSTNDMIRLMEYIAASHGDGSSPGIFQRTTAALFTKQVIRVPCSAAQRALISYGLGSGGYNDGTLGNYGSNSGQCCAIHFDRSFRVVIGVGISAPTVKLRNRLTAELLRKYRSIRVTRNRSSRPCEGLTEADIVGLYIGGVAGQDLSIFGTDGDFRIKVHDKQSGKTMERCFSLDSHGELIFHKHAPFLQYFFFRVEEAGGTVHLMCGWHAYKRLNNDQSISNDPREAVRGDPIGAAREFHSFLT